MARTFLAALVLLLVAVSSPAHALTLGPNQSLIIGDPGLILYFSGLSGAESGNNYKVVFSANGNINLGNIASGRFDTVAFNAALNSAEIYRITGGTEVAVGGALTGSFTADYTNVSVNLGSNQAAALNGLSTGTASFSMNGTIDGKTVSLSPITLMTPYMQVALNEFSGVFNNTVNAFGVGGVANFSMSIDGISDFTNAWVKANAPITFNGAANNFFISGDVHANLTAVPEPLTLGLLASGLVGGVIRRKKQSV